MKKISWYYKKLIFALKKRTDIDKKIIKYNSLNDLFNYFVTDKGTNVKNPYNKNSNEIFGHGFAEFYEKHFEKFKNENLNFLEIGTWKGASLASFTKYFPYANVHGVDRNFKFEYKSKRITFHSCNTSNINDLNKLNEEIAEKKFKIIIDDGSHLLNDIIHNLIFFFKFVEHGGYYIIEDFNHPEYYSYLNNSSGNELLVRDIINKLKNKDYFESKILDKDDQKYLFENIKEVNVYKGKMFDVGKNVSDIAFFRK